MLDSDRRRRFLAPIPTGLPSGSGLDRTSKEFARPLLSSAEEAGLILPTDTTFHRNRLASQMPVQCEMVCAATRQPIPNNP